MSHSEWSQRASSGRPMHPHLPSGRGWGGGVARRQVPACRSALLFQTARHATLPEKLLAHACRRTAITVGLPLLLAPSVGCSQRTVLKLIQVNRQIQDPHPNCTAKDYTTSAPGKVEHPHWRCHPIKCRDLSLQKGRTGDGNVLRNWVTQSGKPHRHQSQHMSLGVLGSPRTDWRSPWTHCDKASFGCPTLCAFWLTR